jgi:hypothetical protein
MSDRYYLDKPLGFLRESRLSIYYGHLSPQFWNIFLVGVVSRKEAEGKACSD